jgi:hypothetical protein
VQRSKIQRCLGHASVISVARRLQEVTLIGNDHAAVLAAAVDPSDRVSRLVMTSCEAFENYPPGLPGKNLRLTAAVPGAYARSPRPFDSVRCADCR